MMHGDRCASCPIVLRRHAVATKAAREPNEAGETTKRDQLVDSRPHLPAVMSWKFYLDKTTRVLAPGPPHGRPTPTSVACKPQLRLLLNPEIVQLRSQRS